MSVSLDLPSVGWRIGIGLRRGKGSIKEEGGERNERPRKKNVDELR